MEAGPQDKQELCKNMEMNTRQDDDVPPLYESAIQAPYPTAAQQPPAYHPQSYATSVVVTQPQQPMIVLAPPYQGEPPLNTCLVVCSFVFSCVVFWGFCWPIGCCSFFLAVAAVAGHDRKTSRTQLYWANALSLVGVILGVIIITLYFTVFHKNSYEDDSYTYRSNNY